MNGGTVRWNPRIRKLFEGGRANMGGSDHRWASPYQHRGLHQEQARSKGRDNMTREVRTVRGQA